jgi:UDP-N-acetylmuramoyl-tripeptide--D-alanyl-D-alanine ligase/murE/murF fusion protein
MIENCAEFDVFELAVIFGEKNLINFDYNSIFNGISIDTRKIENYNIFVALKGEKLNGHDKIKEAFKKGAGACIVEKDWFDLNKNKKNFYGCSFIITNDNVEALGKLANYHRNRFDYPIIAVAGSNGKTTTKEMTAHVLSVKFDVLKTHENFNNLLGVPLMLLSMNDNYDLAVLELGTNQPGEIYALSKMVQPTHVIITNIGKEHLEFLIDLDGVELEETSIFSFIRNDGFAFINNDDERLKKYSKIIENYMTFGTSDDVSLQAVISLNELLKPTIQFKYEDKTFEVKMNTAGYTSALNAIAAAAVGIHFDLNDSEITSALESFQPLLFHGYGRMAIEKVRDFTLINDCYNANPSSMSAALENLANAKTSGKKIAVLGDMRELGETSLEEHISILKQALEVSDFVFITGNEFYNAYNTLNSQENIIFFNSKIELAAHLKQIISENDIILVKGSRGMKMEEVIALQY